MLKKVNNKVDFIELEHEILDFWKIKNIFEKRKKMNQGMKKWSFIDGPITANNPMGVHHAWGRTLKDLYNRYKSMTKHELRYQQGFDCQGLWVEVEVEKELGFKSKKDIENYGIEKFVNKCKDRVKKFSDIQTNQSKRLGYWMDWDNSYYTMSDENNYTIWSLLKKLQEKGKIYRGSDVVPWSGRSGTSYSQMEIIEGRKLVSHRAVFIRFPIKNKKNEFLLVWTTTPWTLTSNVVVGINVKLDYVKIKSSDDSVYYFASENLNFKRLDKQFKEKKQWIENVPKLKTISQIFKEKGGYEIVGKVRGKDMIGWEYEGPFDNLKAQNEIGGYPFRNEDLFKKGVTASSQHKIIDPGKDSMGKDIVVSGEGSGIVHMAPGCGDIDNKVGKKQNLINISPLNEESKFTSYFGWLEGKRATDKSTIDLILDDLNKNNFLVYVEEYPHVYPHCWRSGDELVFRLVDEWYINMDWRNQIKDTLNDINWIPSWGKDRENEWLDNMGDWMISKKRFWGLALPIWIFEDESFYVVGSKEELKELCVEGWDEFEKNSPHRPWIDNVKIKHPETGLIGTRIKDVGNPWLDAGIVPFSTLGYKSNKKYWKEWFPGDFITESFPGQFRNWFYSLLSMSAFLENKAPFKTLLGHALVKDENGKDMHKSTGNAIWFDDAAEEIGVDVMRWMYASQNPENNLLFGYGIAEDIRKKLITLWNVYSFFVTYARLDKFDPTIEINQKNYTQLDLWILSKINKLIKIAENSYENYRIDKFMKHLDLFLDDLSNWYVRRNRRRFWKAENDDDKNAAYQTLYRVLKKLIFILAPIAPFVTEKIYQNLVRNLEFDSKESVHLNDFPVYDKNEIDENLIHSMDGLVKIVELGRFARNKASIKIRQPLTKLCIFLKDENIKKLILQNENQIKEELNIKEIEFVKNQNDLIIREVSPNFIKIREKFDDKINLVISLIKKIDYAEYENKIDKYGYINVSDSNNHFELTKDDFLIKEKSVKNFSSVCEADIVVGIFTNLNDNLIQEGIVRDFIRNIQNFRKELNFNVEDRISVNIKAPENIENAIMNFKEYFCNEILANELYFNAELGDKKKDLKINNQLISISLIRK